MTERSVRRWMFFALLAIGVLLFSGHALAAGSVAKLSRQLLKHNDFRVRTQAALALGASGTEAAVSPLCQALDDRSTTVRAAAAAGLGKLKKGGTKCLKRRLAKERKDSVKAAIRKILASLDKSEELRITASTRYYVAVGEVTDPSGKQVDRLHEVVRRAMADAVSSRGDFVVAPAGETPEASRKKLKGRRDIKGFYLAPKVPPPDYSGGNLTVRFEIAIFTYPTRVLKGMLPLKLTQQGVSSESKAYEDNLVKMAAERAMQKFAGQAERIQ